jgi:DNA-binding CsgD family transcriptional regulator/PAS domain-containing protein
MRDDVDAVIDLAYDAAVEPTLWPEALSRVAVMSNAVGALVVQDDFAHPEHSFLLPGRLAPELYTNYVAEYMADNPWALAAMRTPIGEVISLTGLVPADLLMRARFYHDILRPQGILHCLVETASRTATGALSVAVVRSPEAGPGDDEDRALFGLVSHHLARAARLTLRIADAARQRAALEDALDALDRGMVLVDRGLRLIWSNRAADRILASNDGLSLSRGIVHAASPAVTHALASLVCRVAARRRGRWAIRIDRPSLAEPYIVFAAPLGTAERWPAASGAATVLVVTDPAAHPGTDEALLSAIYDLTPAEARVALIAASGKGLAKAAGMLHVSQNTAHTHLQRVFRKLGVRRQAELSRLLARLPPLAEASASETIGSTDNRLAAG